MALYWSIVLASIAVSTGLNVQTLDEDVGEVVLTNMVYRHGERAVLQYVEGDPLTELKYWPKGYGELTNTGIQHQYDLGRWLGKRYKNLIPGGQFNRSLFYFVSDDTNRTIMSGEANLAGMFPVVGNDIWSICLGRWLFLRRQPIPLQVIPKDKDNLIEMTAPCPRKDTLMRELLHSKSVMKIMDKYENLWLKTEKRYPGLRNMSRVNASYLAASDISCEIAENYPITDWAKENYQELNHMSASLLALNWTPELMQLVGGPLLKEILKSIQAKADGSSINIVGYSAHDDTIAYLFNILGVYNNLPPPFAAVALIELRKTKNNEFVVTIVYQNNTNPEDEPFLLTPKGCDSACPMDKFVALYQNSIPTDWAQQCKEDDSSNGSKTTSED